MRLGTAFVLLILTLVLGVALGRWWRDRALATRRGREEAARSAERHLAAPPGPEEPRPANASPSGAPAAPGPANPANPTVAIPPDTSRPPTDPPTAPKLANPLPSAPGDPQAQKTPPDPSTAVSAGDDEAVAKMLAVLFMNSAFRDRIVDQMVAQVDQRVTFSDAQREAARKELAGALQPLVDLFQKGPVDMKELDPKFQRVKEDWKRRLTPLLTAEQGLAFQKWLDEKHSLQVKMGMDEKGDPVDPETKGER